MTPDHIHDEAAQAPEAAGPQAPPAGPPAPATDPESSGPAPETADAGADGDPEAAGDPEADGAGAPDGDLAARAAQADEYLALAQRKQAEFENFRKRAARDSAAASERGAAKLASALLPAIDNLERALQHAPQDADTPSAAEAVDGFVTGVRHVHTDLIAALQRSGIEQYSPEGETFDPNRHEAIAQQPIEGAEPGTVVEVYQRGYRAGETVVRPARVVVAG
jgi:molecular chaperone GrpE